MRFRIANTASFLADASDAPKTGLGISFHKAPDRQKRKKCKKPKIPKGGIDEEGDRLRKKHHKTSHGPSVEQKTASDAQDGGKAEFAVVELIKKQYQRHACEKAKEKILKKHNRSQG